MCRVILASLAAITAAFAAAPVPAQDIMSGGINQSWSSTQLLLNSEKKAWAAPECVDEARWSADCDADRPPSRRQADRQARKATPDPAPVLDGAALTFRPSLERRRRNFGQFIAKARATDPAGAVELEKFLASDVIGNLGGVIAPYGLRTDNVADAMAVYVLQAWDVINGTVLETSRAQALAVRRQMIRAISSTPAFADAGDDVKQEMAEAMLIQAVMVTSSSELARQKGDPQEIAAVRAAVKKGSLATLGFDLGDMTLTEAGLRDRK